jgi:hypothetical protein
MNRETPRTLLRFSLRSTFIVFTVLIVSLGVVARRYHAWQKLSHNLSALGPLVRVQRPSLFPEHDSAILSWIEDMVLIPTIEEVAFHGDWSPPPSPNEEIWSYLYFKTSNLNDQHIKDTVEILSRLDKCPKLSFIGTELTDEGLRELQKLPLLEDLDLTGSKISAVGITHLSGLKFKHLDLSYTDLSDDSISALAQFRELETLNISMSRISESGVNQLRALLPNCKINCDHRAK